MKKYPLHKILFFSFAVILLFFLIFVIRELVYINGFVRADKSLQIIINQKATTDKMISIFNSETEIVKNTMITENQNDFSRLMKEHEENISLFNNAKEELSLLAEQNNSDVNRMKIIKLNEELSHVYNKEVVPLIKALINNKEKFSESESYSSGNIKTGEFSALAENIQETESQIKESAKIVSDNLSTIKTIIQKSYTEITEHKNDLFRGAELNLSIFTLLIILLFAFVYIYLNKYFFKPFNDIQEYINKLSEGELPEDIYLNSGTEVVKIASGLNKTVAELKKVVTFINELQKGKFDLNFEPLNADDALGNALAALRENMSESQKEEIRRKEEDAQRQRTNEGLTMFAEILRKHSDNIQDLADTVISNLVKFLDANQGALFFLNDDNPDDIYFELIGAYAYNRKKYLSKKIKPGEGLVGAVVLEKYTVHMNEIPEDYIEIESGTGGANPRSVLIVPLKVEEEVLGVIELASFKEFKKEEVKMTEKIAESIAGSLSGAKITIRTAELNEQFSERVKLLQQTEKELEKSLNKIKELNRKIARLERENNRMKKIIES